MHRSQRIQRQQPAAVHGVARKALRRSGTWSVLFGGVSVLAGCLPPPVDWVLTTLGLALVGTGVWSIRAPRPTVVVADAVVLFLVGAYSVHGAVIQMVDGLPPSPFRAVLGLLQILWGIRRFRKFGSLFHGPSFDDEKKAIHQMVGAIRQVATSDVAGLLEFEAGGGGRRRVWKGRIDGDRVEFVEVRGPGRLVGTRGTITIRARPAKAPNGPREAEISVGATRIRTRISPKALRVLTEWMAGRSTAKAA